MMTTRMVLPRSCNKAQACARPREVSRTRRRASLCSSTWSDAAAEADVEDEGSAVNNKRERARSAEPLGQGVARDLRRIDFDPHPAGDVRPGGLAPAWVGLLPPGMSGQPSAAGTSRPATSGTAVKAPETSGHAFFQRTPYRGSGLAQVPAERFAAGGPEGPHAAALGVTETQLDRLTNAIEAYAPDPDRGGTAAPGTLASLRHAEKLDVYLARACETLTVGACDT